MCVELSQGSIQQDFFCVRQSHQMPFQQLRQGPRVVVGLWLLFRLQLRQRVLSVGVRVDAVGGRLLRVVRDGIARQACNDWSRSSRTSTASQI